MMPKALVSRIVTRVIVVSSIGQYPPPEGQGITGKCVLVRPHVLYTPTQAGNALTVMYASPNMDEARVWQTGQNKPKRLCAYNKVYSYTKEYIPTIYNVHIRMSG